MTHQLQQKQSSAAFTSANPILANGELGVESDTLKFKVGDGVTRWKALAYGAATGVPTVTGSRAGNAALTSLLTQLAAQGLIINNTSA